MERSAVKKRFVKTLQWLTVMSLVAACDGSQPIDGSPTFRRYWASQQAYLRQISSSPELAREVPQARATIAAMRDDQIERLITLGYPALVAASEQGDNDDFLPEQGVDWTRYSGPHGGAPSDRAADEQLARMRRFCADYRFETVRGHVVRSPRAARDGRVPGVGIVPFGVVDHLGILKANGGQRLRVTWSSHWYGKDYFKNRQRHDPLDDEQHVFELRRLPGARNWTVLRWSDGPADQLADYELTADRCAKVRMPNRDQ